MTSREMLIQEIHTLPDSMINQLLVLIKSFKADTQKVFVSETSNEFYDSGDFKAIVSQSIAEHHRGETVNMDIL